MRHELFVGWFDFYAARTAERLEGLTDAEYLWEPVSGCWSVRPRADGDGFELEGFGIEEDAFALAPFTTIAWRMVHVVASLSDHWIRPVAFEGGFADFHPPVEVPGTAADALETFGRACATWRADIERVDDARLDELLGPNAGPFGDEVVATFIEHIHDEFIHHMAEIGLLRDLYARRFAPS